MADIEYDDSNLQKMFAELEPKRRLQSIKGGLRRTANKVKRKAAENLRSEIKSSKETEKGIRTALWVRRATGFRVTVGTKRLKKGQTRGKPVALWAETGTTGRYTKNNGGRRAFRKRKGHYTGIMRSTGFMTKTNQEVAGSVTQELHDMVTKEVIRISKKYGCR